MDDYQLPLNIQLRDDASLESFYPGDNLEAYQAVARLSKGSGENFLYLWGQPGVGRSHLLQAACQQASLQDLPSFYLSLKEKKNTSPMLLQGIGTLSLVCLDDIDCIAGDLEWEEAFFHLFNQLRSNQGRLLVGSEVAPRDLRIELADLKSRLSSGVIYQLHRMNDDQKLAALQLRAHQRGLELSTVVGQFLLSRCSRSLSELFGTLEILDRASLAEQRRLTIPFVKHVLEI